MNAKCSLASLPLAAAALVFVSWPASGQTEFPDVEEALSLMPESLRPNVRQQIERRIKEKPAGPELIREFADISPVEKQLETMRERIAKQPSGTKASIQPLDVSPSPLAKCSEILATPIGAAVDSDRLVNGFQRFFKCSGDGATISMEEYAWKSGNAQAFAIREMTTTELNVGGVLRRAILLRDRDAAGNGITQLSWRHGDRLVRLEITGIGPAQEKRLRDIALTLPPGV